MKGMDNVIQSASIILQMNVGQFSFDSEMYVSKVFLHIISVICLFLCYRQQISGSVGIIRCNKRY